LLRIDKEIFSSPRARLMDERLGTPLNSLHYQGLKAQSYGAMGVKHVDIVRFVT
jgi:hypothetical protein